ncbi:MAG: RDD family protein [Candidatus Eisenbacteria bacterium]|nr:RDD family protein [Candidatus Eisenbacteria bacterium]
MEERVKNNRPPGSPTSGEPHAGREEPPLDRRLVPADRAKRAGAFFIDWFIGFLLGMIPAIGWLAGSAYMLLRDGFSSGILDRRSLGKKAMRIRPVVLAGSPVTFAISARRNVIFAVPLLLLVIPVLGLVLAPAASIVILIIETGLVLTDRDGRRYGDRIAGTLVVESEG